MGVTEHILQKSQLLKFTNFSLGYIREKGCNFWSFESILMKSHTMIEKTLSEHMIMVILHFWAKYVVFEQHLSKLPDFYRINSNGFRKHSLKIWAWSDNFSSSTGIESLKYKEIRVSGAKPFFEEYICQGRLVRDNLKQETAKDGMAGLQSGNKIWEEWLRTSLNAIVNLRYCMTLKFDWAKSRSWKRQQNLRRST